MRTDRAVTRMSSDRVAMRPIVDRMTDACENIRAHSHQASASMLQQFCNDTSNTVLIENNGVAWKWVAAPFWSDSIVFNGNSFASVIAGLSALTLTLGVNRPLPSVAVDKYNTPKCFQIGDNVKKNSPSITTHCRCNSVWQIAIPLPTVLNCNTEFFSHYYAKLSATIFQLKNISHISGILAQELQQVYCNNNNHQMKQECIPVGCVPPTCCPYLPACSEWGGVPCQGGFSLPRGILARGGLLGRGVGYASMHWGRPPPLWTESQTPVKI